MVEFLCLCRVESLGRVLPSEISDRDNLITADIGQPSIVSLQIISIPFHWFLLIDKKFMILNLFGLPILKTI
jgi:hypothetical protein